jgi:ectoine hydroxylase-related dioxygenase (phytanoyl-CoA dioxygenase family)
MFDIGSVVDGGALQRPVGVTSARPGDMLPRASVMAADACRLEDFRAVVEVETRLEDYPHADRIERGVLVYDMTSLIDRAGRRGRRSPSADPDIRNEISRALSEGPGIVAFPGGLDPTVVDRATEVFFDIIAAEKTTSGDVGDHFARPGANERVWNALEKLAVADPDVYVDYYANEAIALGALSWLGPAYAVTSQINVVNPGGEAQMPHCDYHLGFMTVDRATEYPVHAHRASPLLTLQGAIAHCEMPEQTGSTMFLPGSHRYELGYLAWRRPEFIEYFAAHHQQLPLTTGDVVFFNPSLFHGAGTNHTSDVHRVANLLQISSPMGIPIETVDRERMVLATYETLARRLSEGVEPELVGHAAATTAQGYAFPTNLDRDQPVGELTPPSQLDLLVDALGSEMSLDAFRALLAEHTARRESH